MAKSAAAVRSISSWLGSSRRAYRSRALAPLLHCALAVALSACGDDTDIEVVDGGSSSMLDASLLDADFEITEDGYVPGKREEELFDGGTRRNFYWADWTVNTTGPDATASGFITLPSGRLDLTYRGQLLGAQVEPNNPRNFWAVEETYESSAVDRAPDNTDCLQIDGIVGGTLEVSFSKPVKDPIFAFGSLGSRAHGAAYKFEVPFLLLSQGKGFYKGDGWLEKLGTDTLVGHEANGVIGFQGTFTSIRWTTTQVEPWHALTVGVAEDVPAAQ